MGAVPNPGGSEPRDPAVIAEGRLDWRVLSDTVQVGSTDGRAVAVLYAVDAGDSWEMCGLLTDTPDQEIEVLFDVGEGASAWDTRWQRGQNGCELLYAEYLAG